MVLSKEEILERRISRFLLKPRNPRPNGSRGIKGLMPSMRSTRRPLKNEEAGLMPSLQDSDDILFHSALPFVNDEYAAGEMILENVDVDNISDVAIDLRVGEDIFVSKVLKTRIRGIDGLLELERKGEVKRVKKQTDGSFHLEPDGNGRNVYYVPSFEKLALPMGLDMIIDAKSTTGRVFAMCNERSRFYFSLPFARNQPKQVVVSVQPHNFPLKVWPAQTSLYQAIIRYDNSNIMTASEIIEDTENIGLFNGNGENYDLKARGRIRKDGLLMNFATGFALKAKLAREVPEPIDMDKRDHYNIEDYFEFIEGNDHIILEGSRCYLMGTIEGVSLGNVCGHLSRETEDTGTGLWGHFAGRIQPGFNGRITMECRSNVTREITKGDPAGFIEFDKMNRPLEKDEGYDGSYKAQVNNVPLPPKMFKPL